MRTTDQQTNRTTDSWLRGDSSSALGQPLAGRLLKKTRTDVCVVGRVTGVGSVPTEAGQPTSWRRRRRRRRSSRWPAASRPRWTAPPSSWASCGAATPAPAPGLPPPRRRPRDPLRQDHALGWAGIHPLACPSRGTWTPPTCLPPLPARAPWTGSLLRRVESETRMGSSVDWSRPSRCRGAGELLKATQSLARDPRPPPAPSAPPPPHRRPWAPAEQTRRAAEALAGTAPDSPQAAAQHVEELSRTVQATIEQAGPGPPSPPPHPPPPPNPLRTPGAEWVPPIHGQGFAHPPKISICFGTQPG